MRHQSDTTFRNTILRRSSSSRSFFTHVWQRLWGLHTERYIPACFKTAQENCSHFRALIKFLDPNKWTNSCFSPTHISVMETLSFSCLRRISLSAQANNPSILLVNLQSSFVESCRSKKDLAIVSNPTCSYQRSNKN